MSQIYPLNIVVSSDKEFANAFNAQLSSMVETAHCLSVEDASSLVDGGAKFSNIILTNNEGEYLLSKISPSEVWDEDFMPVVSRMNLSEKTADSVKDAQEIIELSTLHAGMG